MKSELIFGLAVPIYNMKDMETDNESEGPFILHGNTQSIFDWIPHKLQSLF